MAESSKQHPAAVLPARASGSAAGAGWLLPLLLSLLLAVGLLAFAEAGSTWLAFLVLGMGVAAASLLIGDVQRVMLFMFILTIGVDISKALVVPAGAYSPGLYLYVSDVFLMGFAAAWLLNRWLVKHERLQFDRLHRFAFLYLGSWWFAALYSENWSMGALAALTYSKFFLAYLALSFYGAEPRIFRTVLAAFFVSMLLQAVYATLQLATGSPLEIQGAKNTTVGTELVFMAQGTVRAFRPAGFLQHPNVFARYLLVLLPVAGMLFVLGRQVVGARVRLAAGVVLLLGSALLVVTLSRGTWIAAAVAAIFAVGVAATRGLLPRRAVAMMAGSIATGVVVVAMIYPQAYLRITEGDQRSAEARTALISQAVLIVQRNPLFGVGLGAYNSAAQHTIPESFSYFSLAFQEELLKALVHNKYLLVAAEQGLLGLLLLLLLLWRFAALLRPIAGWRDPTHFAIAVGLCAVILGQAVCFMFDHFYSDVSLTMLWVVFGLFHALARMRDQRASSSGAG